MESWGGLLVSYFAYLGSLSEQHLSISFDSFAIILILFLAFTSLLCCLPLMFCCARRKVKSGSPYSRKEIICKKGLFALMLARLDEFDTLTPLILTPAGPSIFQEIVQTPVSQQTVLNPYIPRTASNSPPPPRRSNQGKTLIVPLNTSKYFGFRVRSEVQSIWLRVVLQSHASQCTSRVPGIQEINSIISFQDPKLWKMQDATHQISNQSTSCIVRIDAEVITSLSTDDPNGIIHLYI
uniref:Transmembrane protein n=1 Tax=Heterorhabditis bacteriophora TaxID=37862 RepID=A0A1I7XQA9_HETBA